MVWYGRSPLLGAHAEGEEERATARGRACSKSEGKEMEAAIDVKRAACVEGQGELRGFIWAGFFRVSARALACLTIFII